MWSETLWQWHYEKEHIQTCVTSVRHVSLKEMELEILNIYAIIWWCDLLINDVDSKSINMKC